MWGHPTYDLASLMTIKPTFRKNSRLLEQAGSSGADPNPQPCNAQKIWAKQHGKIELISIRRSGSTGFIKAYLNQYLQHLVSLYHASNSQPDPFEKVYRNCQYGGSPNHDVHPDLDHTYRLNLYISCRNKHRISWFSPYLMAVCSDRNRIFLMITAFFKSAKEENALHQLLNAGPRPC